MTAPRCTFQPAFTGHTPKAVTVVASEETVVLTLHEALTPAEKIPARTESGAAKVEQYHRALFAVSCDELRKEIQRLTGRRVREAAVVVEPATGAIVLANRQLGPEAPMQLVHERAPDGFDDIGDVISRDEILAVTEGYRRTAGFALEALASGRSLADADYSSPQG